MRYTIRHVTRFDYEKPITESIMEARMQPRSDGLQRCVHFSLTTSPASRVMLYQDHEGKAAHHFSVPGRHARLTLTAQALVDCAPAEASAEAVAPGAWDALDAHARSGEWGAVRPRSQFATTTDALREFAAAIGLERGGDPLTT